jgi:DNA-binding CsgD family transcriptional regulator
MALVQAAAIGGSLALLATGGRGAAGDIPVWMVVLVGIGMLRVITAGASLAISTLVLEPFGVAVFLSGTGGAASPFLPMALAGIWWAGRSGRGTPARAYRIIRRAGPMRLDKGADVEIGKDRPTLLVYGLSLAIAYGVLVVPTALREGMAAEALEDGVVLVATWLLAEVAFRLPRLAPPPLPAAAAAPRAADAGLSQADAHLLACLALGLTNRQIADVMQVSHGRVRYRLSLLYRTLGVDGRAHAVERAGQLKISIPIDQRGTSP